MPIVWNGFGIDTAMMWRGGNPKKTQFMWESRDGSKLLTETFPTGYGMHFLHDKNLPADAKKKRIREVAENLANKSLTNRRLFPFGMDHYAAPRTSDLDLVRNSHPDVREMTMPHYMKELKQDLKGREKEMETLQGSLVDNTTAYTLQGVFSSRLYLKQANRQLEHQLVKTVEPMMAFSRLMLATPPRLRTEELNKAWTEILRNQPHDSICGTSIDEVHLENEARFNTAKTIADDLQLKQTAEINSRMAGPGQWIIFNNSGKPYTGVVKVKEWAYPTIDKLPGNRLVNRNPIPGSRLPQVVKEDMPQDDHYELDLRAYPGLGKRMLKREGLIWVENVPPFGTKVVSQGELLPPEPLVTAHNGISNGLIKMRIKPDGSLSVTDLKTGKSYDDMHRIQDQPDIGDSYNSGPIPGAPKEVAKLQQFKLVEQGPLRSAFELTYTLPNKMKLVTRVSMEAGNPQLQFETTYTNNTPSHKMQVIFPTDAPVSKVRAESQFGIEERQFDPNYNEVNEMPIKPEVKELRTNTGPIQRFVMANNQLILTEGLTEYEVAGNNMNITLLRAFGKLSDVDTGVRNGEAGPAFDTPDGQMIGREMKVRYGWQPAPPKDSEAYDAADRFYGTVHAEQGRSEKAQPLSEKSMVRWDNPSIVASAVKWADNGKGLLVRVVNTSNQTQELKFNTGFDYKNLWTVDFAEKKQARKPIEDAQTTIKPYGVSTFIFEV